MKVLITGANGFLGSHFVEKSLQKGYKTTAAVRANCDLANLSQLSGFDLLEFDFTSEKKIQESLDKAGPQDLIIHNAGLTKSYTLDKYLQVNVKLTRKLTSVIKEGKFLNSGGKFSYISSLAARGPVGNGGPASNYGISKLKAEGIVKSSGLNYMIFRPAGVYGSRDVQFVPLINAVKLGLYPLMTSKDHKMALINARDVAENVIECSLAHANETVHLDDGNVYLHKDLKATLETVLNKKSRSIHVPAPITKKLLYFSDIVDKSFNRVPKLSLEHYREISQDWNHDYSEERKKIPLKIEYSLLEGFQEVCNVSGLKQ